MSTKPLGAQLSHMLKSRGVEVIFGIPGVHNQEMYRGIEEAGITHVLARNEQGAGFMADGYARATGTPGVAYVITGPGLCNIMNPVGQAYSDSVPLLVIASCLDETVATRGQLHQMLDQEGAGATVAEWSETPRTANAAYHLIDRALLEFQTSRPRPKLMNVPIALLEAEAAPAADRSVQVAFDAPNSDQIARIAGMLAKAKRPVVILGGGACRAEGLAAEVATRAGAAVFMTNAGRGLYGDDAPLSFGACLSRPGSADIMAQADLVLVLGSELSECDLWRGPLGHDCPMVRVDLDPQMLVDRHNVTDPVLADCTVFCEALLAAMEPSGSDWDAAAITALRAKWRAETDADRPGIVPLVDALRAVLPSETMIFSDMTQFAYVANETFPMDRPGHWHHPSGFGTLGYALPAAIGGKVGAGDKPVISINGDSGFQYNIQELATAVELGLSLPIIVWDNGKLKEIEDGMINAQIAPNAVVARNPDFCKLAEAYGAHAVAPRSLEAFKQAVTDALAADGPTLIHVTPETAGG
ncbi:acetolactate synthase-1/2/3 large subunit/5-guanidino-2-oxopentanoate decarboxylase [Litoreibacter meonggei]|uniref:Acetolactate synthase-1/2/3 large subunit/5-guanidino-2-oxopentanoate decarboxylase n=1 Tax=Litoreibacter meonggei TaxID=1049199 RepID=A0A497X533_9RHOB|nr:thiamine pyrophosphate-binding protein [Litoreibacter meonggei]RLJ60171.1 acetolactate synthase-1/2/3 large subunit/5-guanidino-2-oxopentanoate decarboxylase [Litoreibacter meonggei]